MANLASEVRRSASRFHIGHAGRDALFFDNIKMAFKFEL